MYIRRLVWAFAECTWKSHVVAQFVLHPPNIWLEHFFLAHRVKLTQNWYEEMLYRNEILSLFFYTYPTGVDTAFSHFEYMVCFTWKVSLLMHWIGLRFNWTHSWQVTHWVYCPWSLFKIAESIKHIHKRKRQNKTYGKQPTWFYWVCSWEFVTTNKFYQHSSHV